MQSKSFVLASTKDLSVILESSAQDMVARRVIMGALRTQDLVDVVETSRIRGKRKSP
jgi:hypothetical protein